MPDLNEILKERKTKKFVKKNYRPWDLSGQSNENDIIAETEQEVEKIQDNYNQGLLTLEEKDPRRLFEGAALLRRMHRYGLLSTE